MVSFEARKIFLESYTCCFNSLGQKGIYLNFELDTLGLVSSLKSLQRMARKYPAAMSKVQ
jgi:hypothetical protein